MFVTMSKHNERVDGLRKENHQLEKIIQEQKDYIHKLQDTLKKELEIAYNYHFPQEPKTIIVSEYVAENFLENKTTFVPQYPFPKYQYEGLDIKVDKYLKGKKVLFEAEWVEPPVICKSCGIKNDYEFSYPKDNPNFCDERCFREYVRDAKRSVKK